jgi:hypothetical protein
MRPGTDSEPSDTADYLAFDEVAALSFAAVSRDRRSAYARAEECPRDAPIRPVGRMRRRRGRSAPPSESLPCDRPDPGSGP